MKLHCEDGFDVDVGEDYETFQEDRAVTFQKFIDEAPEEFKHLAQVEAPYRILEPGAGNFKAGKSGSTTSMSWRIRSGRRTGSISPSLVRTARGWGRIRMCLPR